MLFARNFIKQRNTKNEFNSQNLTNNSQNLVTTLRIFRKMIWKTKKFFVCARYTRKVLRIDFVLLIGTLFLIFYQIFLSPQAKRIVIISNKHSIYELPHELPKDLRRSQIFIEL